MMFTRSRISCEDLYVLYVEKQLTFAEIADQFGCNPITIHKRLKDGGFQARPPGGSVFEYPKKDFAGSLGEKAYLRHHKRIHAMKAVRTNVVSRATK